MNVSLTPELDRYVEEKVKSGRYRSASEVLRESLRAMQQAEEEREARLVALRREVGRGVDELDRGLGVNGEQAFARVLEEIERGD
ncbi:MAG TPA: type II toxin-antitoxin system ParD family antitoxin [Longimicrobium sp.]|nr:type II toxin-antitoxin system ParD family antitoxin [Longimicrobium sp.]